LPTASACRRGTAKTLEIDIDDQAFDRLYGFFSHSFPAGRRVAVRVVSQFGEESTKVLQP
jgi:adenine-specific DNA-methyltransferase